MNPKTPSDPAKGKPDAEKTELEAAEAKAAVAAEAAEEKAEQASGKAPAKKPAATKKASPAKKPTVDEAQAGEDQEDKPARAPKVSAKEEKPAEAKAASKPKAKAPAKPKAPAKAKAEPEASEQPKAQRAAPARRKVVRAQARYVRTSARKARMVCGHLRGKSVTEARAILAFTARDVARDWSKLLESAVANAENNHELLEDDLLVHEAFADEGPTIKRFRPRAQGRATPIRKRTSHLTITLTPKP